ncbi:hypothetical protein SUGI_1017060 [Cryptomeria japonica]|nr:hypothetical protein SUGI_1017060 [Cryptomeria japonica]
MMDSEQQKWACGGISENQGSGCNRMKETEEESNSNAQNKIKNSALKPPKCRLGRPSGSKNKPKNIIVTNQNPMNSKFLEVAAGYDVIQCLIQYCKRNDMNMGILKASGTLGRAAIYQPGRQLQFLHNQTEIICLSGHCSPSLCSLTVLLGHSYDRCEHGFVGSRLNGSQLIAGGPVYVNVASYTNASCHRVSSNYEDESSNIIYTCDQPSKSKNPLAMVRGQGSSLGAPQMAGGKCCCKFIILWF